jgi:hypothetical protein
MKTAPREVVLPGTRPTERMLTVDTNILRSTPEKVAPDEESPHGCYDGWVYLGHLVIEDDGEEAEIVETVPCRRCSGKVLSESL